MLKLIIPNFNNIDWESAIEGAAVLDKDLLTYLARSANILEGLQEEMTPQSLAWMIIWTHVFSTLEGARAAILRNSEFSLHLFSNNFLRLIQIYFVSVLAT